jgi:hypothetical protein
MFKLQVLSVFTRFIAIMFVATISTVTQAGTVTVSVTDAEGKPAPNVVITARLQTLHHLQPPRPRLRKRRVQSK